jgi:hypothetical protein
MIHSEATSRAHVRTQSAPSRNAKGTSPWQRLVASCALAWNRSVVEDAIEREVRRQLGGRPPEPGDVVFVDQIVEQVNRGQLR